MSSVFLVPESFGSARRPDRKQEKRERRRRKKRREKKKKKKPGRHDPHHCRAYQSFVRECGHRRPRRRRTKKKKGKEGIRRGRKRNCSGYLGGEQNRNEIRLQLRRKSWNWKKEKGRERKNNRNCRRWHPGGASSARVFRPRHLS